MKKSGFLIGSDDLGPFSRVGLSRSDREQKSAILTEMPSRVVNDQEPPLNGRHYLAPAEFAPLMVLALAVRLAWVLFGPWESGDSAWYLGAAHNIAFHHVFSASPNPAYLAPTAYRPPLYSAVIAALWFGQSAPVFAVLVLQAILGTATVALVYFVARDHFSQRVAVITSLGMALAPMTGRFTSVILSETLFTFLLTLGVFFWVRQRYVLTGIVFGLSALTRVTIVPFIVLLPLLTLSPPWRAYRRSYATIMFLSLAVVSVWGVRNAIVLRRFVPVAASGYGTNLLLGTLKTRLADDVPQRKALLKDASAGFDEAQPEADRARLNEALTRIVHGPRGWLMARAQQYPRLFIETGSYLPGSDVPLRSDFQQGHFLRAFVRTTLALSNLLVFLLALFAIIVERSRFISLSHLTLFPIYLCLVHLPIWIEPRYGLPMMPLIAILATLGMFEVLKRLSRLSAARYFAGRSLTL
jgi:4-amino-4-deoxy-L-arabinose transferase-like glycosyltransferase